MQKDMQHKLTRLLYELNALDKGTIQLSALALEVGVTVRTLQRDMNDIQKAQFPLWNPTPGEYAFVEGFSLEKMKLSGAEACLLVLMSEMAASLGSHFGESFSTLKKALAYRAGRQPVFYQNDP